MDRYKVFPSGELGMHPAGNWTPYADAQATVEALRAQLPAEMQECTILFKECEKGHGRLTATNWIDHGCQTCAMEALQRERDEWRSNAVAQEVRANDLERDCKDLLSDIDGERSKVGNLLKKIAYWEKRHLTYRELAEENMNLKSDELSALQGLVRALPVVRIDLNGAYHDTLLTQPEDEAVKELLRYRATLDATTPALTIKEARHIALDVLYKAEQERIEASKGGNGE